MVFHNLSHFNIQGFVIFAILIASSIQGDVATKFNSQVSNTSFYSISNSTDIQGPFITHALYKVGPIDQPIDSMKIFFSEPVHCDSLKISRDPGMVFQIFDADHLLRGNALEYSEFLYASTCSNSFITDVIIIIKVSSSSPRPFYDSIRLIGPVVDTCGNYPDTTRMKPLEYSSIPLSETSYPECGCNEGCGCGAGTLLAIIPPVSFRLLRKKKKY